MFDFNRLRHCVVPAIISAVILCGCAPDQPLSTPPSSTASETVPISTTLSTVPAQSTPAETTAVTAPTDIPETTVTTAPMDIPETTATTAPTNIPETTAATVPTEPPETTVPTDIPETTTATTPTESIPTEPEDPTFTVTFRDHDGQVLAVRQVASGQDALLPPNPSRSGYVFAYWEGSHRNITADSTITAVYVSADSPNLFTLDSSVSGDTVTVAVRLQGNILACGIECHLAYDDTVLQYTAMTKHNNVEANHITLSGKPQVILVWAGSQNMTASTIRDGGILLELKFRIIDPSAADTVLSFLGDAMYIDVVDENGSYSNGQFTLTKGVIHLK